MGRVIQGICNGLKWNSDFHWGAFTGWDVRSSRVTGPVGQNVDCNGISIQNGSFLTHLLAKNGRIIKTATKNNIPFTNTMRKSGCSFPPYICITCYGLFQVGWLLYSFSFFPAVLDCKFFPVIALWKFKSWMLHMTCNNLSLIHPCIQPLNNPCTSHLYL